MRAFGTILFTLVTFLGVWGSRFFAGSEGGRQVAMRLLFSIDEFVRDSWSPTMVILGLTGLLTIWLAHPIATHLREHWFGAKRKEYSEAFRSHEQSKARQDFRWGLEAAYRKYNGEANPGELAELIEQIDWPKEFPPTGDLVEYVGRLEWGNEPGEKFWRFVDRLFEPTINPSASELLPERRFEKFLEARRTAAKFWDDWSRQIQHNLVKMDDIRETVLSNYCDIKALAISELAHAKHIAWDRSSGKRPLL